MTRTSLLIRICGFCLLLLPAAARADSIKYYSDPVYVKVAKDEPHPMDDLIALAEGGDPRAQFILADFYAKGKGGLGKNRVKAHYWFEVAARHGYTAAFIRLAALARHAGDDVEAYQWYTLDAKHASGREAKWAEAQRKELAKASPLSDDETREAEKAARKWLDGQADAMKDIKKKEAEAKVAAAAQAAADAAANKDSSDPAANKDSADAAANKDSAKSADPAASKDSTDAAAKDKSADSVAVDKPAGASAAAAQDTTAADADKPPEKEASKQKQEYRFNE